MIKAVLKLIVGLSLLIAILIFGPLLGIWSLNTLFPILAIPYTWQTWAAFFLLFGSITGLNLGLRYKK